MLINLSKQLHFWAKGWLILFIIAAFVVLVNLPLADPDLVSRSLDGQIGYTPAQAFAAVASYGEDGRVQMLWIHLADFILVVTYTALFSLSISWLFRRGFKPDSTMQTLNLVPVLGGFFDVLENVWIMALILVYPAQPTIVAWLATVSTMAKYIMGLIILSLLALGLVRAALNRFKPQDDVDVDALSST